MSYLILFYASSSCFVMTPHNSSQCINDLYFQSIFCFPCLHREGSVFSLHLWFLGCLRILYFLHCKVPSAAFWMPVSSWHPALGEEASSDGWRAGGGGAGRLCPQGYFTWSTSSRCVLSHFIIASDI